MTSGEDTSDCGDCADRPAPSPAKRRPSPIRNSFARATAATLLALALLALLDWFGWISELASALGWRLTAVAVIVAAIELRRPRCAAVALLAATLALLPALLLTPRAPAPHGPPAVTVRLLVANLRATNDRPEALLELLAVSDADVLVLTEPPQSVRRALRPDGALADRFVDIARTRPDRGEHAPLIIASRLPLIDTLESGPGVDAIVLRAQGTEFGLVATQLLSPRTPARNAAANQQASSVAQLGRALSGRGLPLVIAGDLNAAPTSHRSRNLASATNTARAKPRWTPTGSWPARLPAIVAIPIDGAFVSQGIAVARWELVDLPGSDHRGILIELRIPTR